MSVLTLFWFPIDHLIGALILVALSLLYLYGKYQLSYWKRRGVYSPPGRFFLGNFKDALLFRSSPGRLMGNIYKDGTTDDPYIGFYVLHKPCLLIRHPDLIKSILIKDFETFQDRQFGGNAKRDIPGTQNLFSLNNPTWKYVRSKLSPVLTSGKIKMMLPSMIECGEAMLKYMKDQPLDKDSMKNIRFKDTSSKYTTDVISSLAFGVRTNSFQDPEPEFRYHGRNLFVMNISRVLQLFLVFFFPEILDYTRFRMMGHSTNFFRQVFWDSVHNREKSGVRRGDLIDSLIELQNEHQTSEFHFSGDHLFAQSAIFFIAGHETSAMTMTFALMELANHPEIQERARNNVIEQVQKFGMTYEAFQSMKYLNQVISETLRIYPPAPIIDRVAAKDYQVPGYDLVIEKGTCVCISLFGLHEDPKYHPEPEKFDPDRFGDERKHEMIPMTYMPFGEGPRICIGQRIGNLQTLVGLAMILMNYKVALNTKLPAAINPRALFTAFVDDLNLICEEIEPNHLIS